MPKDAGKSKPPDARRRKATRAEVREGGGRVSRGRKVVEVGLRRTAGEVTRVSLIGKHKGRATAASELPEQKNHQRSTTKTSRPVCEAD